MTAIEYLSASINARDLAWLLKRASIFRSVDPNLPSLHCLHLHEVRGAVSVTATDRYRLIRMDTVTEASTAEDGFSAVIPPNSVRVLRAALKTLPRKYNPPVTVKTGGDKDAPRLEVAVDTISLCLPLYCGEHRFPNLDHLVDFDMLKIPYAGGQVVVDGKYLADLTAKNPPHAYRWEGRDTLYLQQPDNQLKPIFFSAGPHEIGMLMPRQGDRRHDFMDLSDLEPQFPPRTEETTK